MESGSIQEVTERLKSWCILHDRGLARVEWDSAYARQEVVNRLKDSLCGLGIPLVEMSLPPGEVAHEGRYMEGTDRKTISVTEARAIGRRFWERLEAARAQDFPEERIWTELAQPAIDSLRSAGLELEADAILASTSDARVELERKL